MCSVCIIKHNFICLYIVWLTLSTYSYVYTYCRYPYYYIRSSSTNCYIFRLKECFFFTYWVLNNENCVFGKWCLKLKRTTVCKSLPHKSLLPPGKAARPAEARVYIQFGLLWEKNAPSHESVTRMDQGREIPHYVHRRSQYVHRCPR